ncbi:MAG: hypothetical protein M3R36_16405 [Bacteroidota bacterium]|nr:hypothetical protein [Bacteroidota bacterium]
MQVTEPKQNRCLLPHIAVVHLEKFFKTTDRGFNWSISLSAVSNSIKSISSFNDSIVWAIRSGVINTTNGAL